MLLVSHIHTMPLSRYSGCWSSMSPGMTLSSCLVVLLALVTVASGTGDDEKDYVPKFFGGRRNDGDRAGIAPPKRKPKMTRSGQAATQQMLNFTQKLDHFNSTCRRSWMQRYVMDDHYFKANRSHPIVFIRIGGESASRDFNLASGPMVLLAKRHGALLFELEHRYYGESRPTVDTKRANLRLLSSQQALADLTQFIKYIRKEYFSARRSDPRIVLYGCSYAGSLAAWHRMFYPDLTAGAVARCAPLHAVANFQDYFQRVLQATVMYTNECYAQIREVFAFLHVCVTNHNDVGLNSILNLCEPKTIDVNNSLAIDSMYYDMVSKLMQTVQYNKMSDGPTSNIGRLCDSLQKSKQSGKLAVHGYADWLKEEQNGSCIEHDGKSILTRNGSWDSPYVQSGTRQWLYQMCHEFGYFTTIVLNILDATNRVSMAQYSDMSFFEQICTQSFDMHDMESRVNKTQARILPIVQKFTNVFFLSGYADPWYSVMMSTTFDSKMPGLRVVSVTNMSHCEEPSDTDDSNSPLWTAWNDVYETVQSWLANP